ncbi:MAG TPA: ethylbenzene dehydrogenase-related protein [Puia sp.]|jgi:hypothetical protein|nr:ethylbenzene dehydrogenase-related protein [Puia sp.]
MKNFRKTTVVTTVLVLSTIALTYCTKNDQVVNTGTTASTTVLTAYKTSTAPVIDGTVDASWVNATKLAVSPTVPDPGNGLFAGYIGEIYPATLRCMYDAQYIYFLAEWTDPTKSVAITPWYFDPTSHRWAQEPSSRSYDANGVLVRDGWGEDKLAMLWNIDHSTPKFETLTCYASCHVFTPYKNYAGAWVPNASGNHYTNGANEKIDMWWLHLSKDEVFSQFDDNYQDWAGGPSVTDTVGGNGNGRHLDGQTPPVPFSSSYNSPANGGSINNRQSLKITGTSTSVNVPTWIIPDASNYNYILATDTLTGGKAAKITAVDANGVLTYNGGTIDPNVGTDYLQVAGIYGGDGPKCFPSFIASPLMNGRADITSVAVYTGTGWIVEYKRLLKTTDALKQDIDFSKLDDQPFGMAIWNKSNNQHGIQPGLTLHFQQ